LHPTLLPAEFGLRLGQLGNKLNGNYRFDFLMKYSLLIKKLINLNHSLPNNQMDLYNIRKYNNQNSIPKL